MQTRWGRASLFVSSTMGGDWTGLARGRLQGRYLEKTPGRWNWNCAVMEGFRSGDVDDGLIAYGGVGDILVPGVTWWYGCAFRGRENRHGCMFDI